MASVTFSVSDKLKSEMKGFAWVNWSELAKQEVLIQDEKAKLFEELEKLTKDSKLTDEDCLRFAKHVKERFAKNSGGQ
ncbi:MAG: hypothetical protein ABIH37_03895 [archaeon]